MVQTNLFIKGNQTYGNFVSSDKVVSTSSKRIFDCVVPNGTK